MNAHKKVHYRCTASDPATEQSIDTKTSAGKAFLDMLGVFAEFETNLRKERQMEGIRLAKERGVYKGRSKSIDSDKVRALKTQGMGASKIAKLLGCSRASVYLHWTTEWFSIKPTTN